MIPAPRMQGIEPFLAVEVGDRAQALERQGIDVVHLEFGEPDFETPLVIREAAEKALKDGRTRYVETLGILPLREAIADHYAATYGVRVSPDQILVTPGTSPAMLLLFGHLLHPGDEVVLSDPYYACYPNFIRYADGIPVSVGVSEEDGFQYRRDQIRPLQKAFGNFFISTNEFVQWAGVAALREAVDEPRRFRAIFDERRRAMVAGLRAIGLGVRAEPTGAFYVLADARRFARDSTRFAFEILERCHVAVTPGAAFGANAEGYLRFSYAAPLDQIREGLRRLGCFLASLT